MFGYDTGELIGRHMDVRNGDAEPSAEVIRSRLTQAIRASGPDGSIRWIRDRGFPIRNPAGQVYRMAGIAEDITLAKQLDEQILLATHHEQNRIGRELHDGVCQLLIGAELSTGVLQQRLGRRKLTETLDAQHLQAVFTGSRKRRFTMPPAMPKPNTSTSNSRSRRDW